MHLVNFFREHKKIIKIFFKASSGKIITLYVESSDTIENVKKKLYKKEGIKPNEQRYKFESRQLEDNKTIGYYKIKK